MGQKGAIRRYVMVLLLVVASWSPLYAQNDSTDFWMIKAYPVLTGFSPNGAILGVERTIDSTSFGAQASVKYFGGATFEQGNRGEVVKPSYVRLEIQGRWYPGKMRKVMYLAPLINLNNKLQPAAGLLIGAQPVFWKKIPLDVNIGFQTDTATDNFDSPLFLRFNVGIGLALKSK